MLFTTTLNRRPGKSATDSSFPDSGPLGCVKLLSNNGPLRGNQLSRRADYLIDLLPLSRIMAESKRRSHSLKSFSFFTEAS